MVEQRHTEVLEARLEADTAAFQRKMQAATKGITGFGKATAKIGAGITAVSGGILAVSGSFAKMAKEVDRSVGEVKTLLPHMGDHAFGELVAKTRDVQEEFGTLSGDAVPALYQAISASVPPENVVDFMRTASKAAIGGVTDLETAVDGITSAVNTYGAEALSAQQASDIMFTTVKLGKTDFEQLSNRLFNVIPTAKSLGVGFEQVGAAMAAMTAQGVPTAQATTQLRQLFVELSKETDLADAVMNTFGKSFADLSAEGMDFATVMQGVRDSMPEEEFRKLFSSVEAQGAALLTTGDAFSRFQEALTATESAAGATDKAFDTMSQTASFKLDKAMAALKLVMEDIGALILPGMATSAENLIPHIKNLRDWIGKLNPELVNMVMRVVTAVAAFGVLLTIIGGATIFIGSAISSFAAIKTALIAVGAAVGAVSLPVALLIAGLVAAGVAAWHWRTELIAAAQEVAAWYQSDLAPQMNAAWEKVKVGAQEVGAWMQTTFGPMWANVMRTMRMEMLHMRIRVAAIWLGVQAAAYRVQAWYEGTFLPAWQKFISALPQEMIYMRMRIGLIWWQITQAFQTARDAVEPILRTIGSVIGRVLLPPLRFFKTVVVFVFKVFANTVKAAWDTIRPILVSQWTDALANMRENLTKLKNDAIILWARIYGVIQAAWSVIGPILGPQFAFAVEQWKKNLRDLQNAFSTAWGWIQFVATAIWTWFEGTFLPGWETMFATLSNIFGRAEPNLTGLWNALKLSAHVVLNFFRDVFGPVFGEIINGVVQEVIWMRVRIGLVWWQITQATTNAWTTVKMFFSETWTSIIATLTSDLNRAQFLIKFSWLSIRLATIEAWTSIKTFFSETWQSIQTTFAQYQLAIALALGITFYNIQANIFSTWNTIKIYFANIWANISGVFQNWLDVVKLKLKIAWLGMRIAAVMAWNAIRNKLSEKWAEIVSNVTNWYTTMRAKFTEQDWGGIGRAIINGIRGGITSAAAGLASAAADAARNALNAAKNFLGIQSPSMLAAMEIGRPFAEGIAFGIQQGQGLIDSQIASSLGRGINLADITGGVDDLLAGGGASVQLFQEFNGPADPDTVGNAGLEGVTEALYAVGAR